MRIGGIMAARIERRGCLQRAISQALEQALGAGMPVVIVPARVNGADYFRVRVGPLENRKTADSLRDHLASQGIANGRVVTTD